MPLQLGEVTERPSGARPPEPPSALERRSAVDTRESAAEGAHDVAFARRRVEELRLTSGAHPSGRSTDGRRSRVGRCRWLSGRSLCGLRRAATADVVRCVNCDAPNTRRMFRLVEQRREKPVDARRPSEEAVDMEDAKDGALVGARAEATRR